MSGPPSAVFLDRDGTLNESPPDGGYVTAPDQLRLLPGVAEAVRRLNDAGVPVLLVSNQRGIARGLLTAAGHDAVLDRLTRLLATAGAHLDGVYVCPHEAGTCDCRKPLPGLLLRAAADRPGLDLASAVMVGDAESDVAAGRAAGTRTVRLSPVPVDTRAELRAADLPAAVELLLTGAPATGRRSRSRLRFALRWVFLAAVLAGVSLALADQWGSVVHRLARLAPGPAALAFLAVLGSELTSMLAWRVLLADLGSPLPVRQAARILFVGQLGKYLPGSVWPVLAQMELGRDAQVPAARTAATYLLTTAVSVFVGAAVGVVSLPGLVGGHGGFYALALLAVPVGLALLNPPVLNRLLRFGLRLLRQPPLERALSGRGVAAAAGLFVGTFLLFGLQVYALSADLGRGGPGVLPLAIGGYALASTAGLVFIPAPAGAGVREAVLVALLVAAMPVAAATAVAIASRLVVTLADVTMAGAAGLTVRGRGESARRPAGR